MKTEFGLDHTLIGWGSFSERIEADYMRDAEEKPLSTSLNFFNHMQRTVNVKINGQGIDTLTPYYQNVYTNNHSMFGIECGDNYVSQYKEGMFIMYGLNLHFESPVDKQNFLDHAPDWNQPE